MTSKLATNLVRAKSAAGFLRRHGGRVGLREFAALKAEVDRLVHSDLNAAANLVERIEQLATLTRNDAGKALALASRARFLHLQGRHHEANPLYAQSAKALRVAGLEKEAAIIQKQQVDALTHLGQYAEAIKTARQARLVFSQGDDIHLAQLETNVGNTYYLQDRYRKALEHYTRARGLLARKGRADMRALIDYNLANTLTELDRPDEALALYKSASRSFDRACQHLAAAVVRYSGAYIELLRGNYNAALKSYYETRDRLSDLGSIHYVAWCDLEIAESLLALNAFDDAMESAERAREQFEKLGMPYESAKSAMITALAAMGVKSYERAAKDLTEARAAFAASGNKTFAALADSYLAELALKRGDAAEASRRASLALRTFSNQKLAIKAAHARLLRARAAYAGKDLSRATRYAKAALRMIEGRFAPSVAYMCHHLIGKLERDRNKNRSALESFHRAVEIVERMRGGIVADAFRATFLGDKMELYEDAISARLEEGSEDSIVEAFRLVESSKSSALADLLARYVRDSSRKKRRPAADDAIRARLVELIEKLNWYNSQANLEDERGDQRRASAADRYGREVARCERQIAELFRRIEGDCPPLGEIERQHSISAHDFRAALQPEETAIEYFSAGDEFSAFLVSRDEIRVVRRVASRRDTERLLAALRFQFEKFNYGSSYADEHFEQLNGAANYHLTLLYNTIFAPLEPFIKTERLIIIPHGPLHYVPFHALVSRRGCLVDRHEISYAPSATVLSLCRRRTHTVKTSNLKSQISNSRTEISNLKSQISSSRSGISNLKSQISNRENSNGHGRLVTLGVAGRDTPNVTSEIRALSELFPDSITLTGRHATADNLRRHAPTARFLHLASHGYFRRDNPMFSFLKLSDAPLNFYSLMDLNLNAEMVTLSACHTGVNMVFPGDELHGLVRGFLYAGAPSVVASLWAANDCATAEFMKEMYTQVRAGATKSAAIRAAHLAVKDNYGHPYYWAPFVLMGNPN